MLPMIDKKVSLDLMEFVEREILPRYADFDKAHNMEHVTGVIRRSLDMLNEKERTILCMYFGLGTSREYSLEEIAMKLDISRERTRQIRDRALKRLKSEPNSPLFQMYMNQ